MAQYKTYATMAGDEDKKGSFVPDVPHVTSHSHRLDIIKTNRIVVIYHHAEWCGPCTKFAPQFNELAQKYARSGVSFVKENVDHDLDRPANITAVPCFHFYYEGQFQPSMTLTGVDVEKIEQQITTLRGQQK